MLLLEAGGDELVLSDLPFAYPALQLSPIDWQYKSEPTDSYCLGFKNHQCNWPRGKVIGGSSVINAMLYVRGNARDYDHWKELGNPGNTKLAYISPTLKGIDKEIRPTLVNC